MLLPGVHCKTNPIKVSRQLIDSFHHCPTLLRLPEDRNNHKLRRGQFRRNDNALIISVRHDQSTDQSSRHTPTGRVDVFHFPFFILELHVEGFRKTLRQMMRRPGLQGLTILHHGFDRVGVVGAGKLLALTFQT